MMRTVGALLLALGVLLLFAGLAAPATNTHRSVTCVDSTYGADGCVETTVKTPNFGKGGLIAMGVTTAVVGGGVIAFGDRSESATDSPNTPQAEETLAAQIRDREGGDDDRLEN